MTGETATDRICGTCGTSFLIPAAEQQFRQARNLQVPDACPECRLLDRTRRNAELIAQHDRSGSDLFSAQDNRNPRGNGSRQGGPHGRGAPGRSQMYNTVCSQCGAETQVPFVPRGDRPVYCRDCYNARRGR